MYLYLKRLQIVLVPIGLSCLYFVSCKVTPDEVTKITLKG